MKLVIINACVRQGESRTLRIAEPVIEALAGRYETVRYDLPEMEGIIPLTPGLLWESLNRPPVSGWRTGSPACNGTFHGWMRKNGSAICRPIGRMSM